MKERLPRLGLSVLYVASVEGEGHRCWRARLPRVAAVVGRVPPRPILRPARAGTEGATVVCAAEQASRTIGVGVAIAIAEAEVAAAAIVAAGARRARAGLGAHRGCD